MGALLRAIIRTRNTVVCERLERADTLAVQSRGLIGRESVDTDAGMLFINARCTPFMWMHMFFMKFPIDIVFLGLGDRVIKINRELKPWRVSSIVFGVRKAIELPAGAATLSGVEVGDLLEFEPAGKSATD
jgi:uncharacterized protein